MTKAGILGIAWLLFIAFTAWYVYKNFRPGFTK